MSDWPGITLGRSVGGGPFVRIADAFHFPFGEELYVPVSKVRERLLSDEVVKEATLAYPGSLHYMARAADFTDEEIRDGALREADEEADANNEAMFLVVLEAALAAAFPDKETEG